MKNRPFIERLGFASAGIMAAWQAEHSFRIQLVMALLVLPLLVWLNPDLVWWAIMIMMGALVLAAELFNTALEHLIDHLHPEIHPTIKVAKDCAAGAVLIFSIASLTVTGCMVWSVLG
jgi:diacylglycerol kinase (ATP)